MKSYYLLLILIFLTSSLLFGGESRNFSPILTPKKKVPQKKIVELPEDLVKNNVNKIFKSWKRGNIGNYISDDFYNKDKFLEAINYKVPVDSRIRVLAIKDTYILNQKSKIKKDGKIDLESLVSTSAITQIEFNDPSKGFRKLEGENEYIIKIKAELVPVE